MVTLPALMIFVPPAGFVLVLEIMSASARPIWPKPSSTASTCVDCVAAPPPIFASWNASWIARCAAGASLAATTNEMFSSEEPCAIATMFTSAADSAPNTRAAMPGWPAMPMPTTASVARPPTISTPSISLRPISSRKTSINRSRARFADASGTLKQIDCSDDDCEISETDVPCR